jgi:hypothetical protein
MEVTPAGMVMAVSALAPLNVPYPIEVIPAGMVIPVRAVAPLNALVPMEVSWLPAAKVTVARLVARKNA